MKRISEYIDKTPYIETTTLRFHANVNGRIVGDIANRLAAYEDICYDDSGNEICSVNHLRSLLAAEKNGQPLMLPCKTGDTIYKIAESSRK